MYSLMNYVVILIYETNLHAPIEKVCNEKFWLLEQQIINNASSTSAFENRKLSTLSVVVVQSEFGKNRLDCVDPELEMQDIVIH